jgi:hypothetical protein
MTWNPFPSVVPPRTAGNTTGFPYDYIERGMFMSAHSPEALATKLREFRAANGYEEGNPEVDIAKYTQSKWEKSSKIMAGTAKTWMATKAQDIAAGKVSYIEEKEVRRREGICQSCRMNQPNMSPCGPCINDEKRMIEILTHGKTQTTGLHHCGQFNMVLPIAVLLSKDTVTFQEDKVDSAPPICWLRSDSTNAVSSVS